MGVTMYVGTFTRANNSALKAKFPFNTIYFVIIPYVLAWFRSRQRCSSVDESRAVDEIHKVSNKVITFLDITFILFH